MTDLTAFLAAESLPRQFTVYLDERSVAAMSSEKLVIAKDRVEWLLNHLQALGYEAEEYYCARERKTVFSFKTCDAEQAPNGALRIE